MKTKKKKPLRIGDDLHADLFNITGNMLFQPRCVANAVASDVERGVEVPVDLVLTGSKETTSDNDWPIGEWLEYNWVFPAAKVYFVNRFLRYHHS